MVIVVLMLVAAGTAVKMIVVVMGMVVVMAVEATDTGLVPRLRGKRPVAVAGRRDAMAWTAIVEDEGEGLGHQQEEKETRKIIQPHRQTRPRKQIYTSSWGWHKMPQKKISSLHITGLR